MEVAPDTSPRAEVRVEGAAHAAVAVGVAAEQLREVLHLRHVPLADVAAGGLNRRASASVAVDLHPFLHLIF
jgi:hypothetical protein